MGRQQGMVQRALLTLGHSINGSVGFPMLPKIHSDPECVPHFWQITVLGLKMATNWTKRPDHSVPSTVASCPPPALPSCRNLRPLCEAFRPNVDRASRRPIRGL